MFEDNNYREGGEHGAIDAATGKGKRYVIRNIRYALRPGFYLPGGSERYSEYRRGYNERYEDFIRWRSPMNPALPAGTITETDKSNLSTQRSYPGGENMSESNSYARQIELMSHLRESLIACQEEILDMSRQYQKALDYVYDAGMMEETYKDFDDNIIPATRDMINNLSNHIRDNDIPAVDREIAFLEQKL